MITTQIILPPDRTDQLHAEAAKVLRIAPEEIRSLAVQRRSIDARKHQVRLLYTVAIDAGRAENRILKRGLAQPFKSLPVQELHFGEEKLQHRPLILGAGPAGLMAAWLLAKEGYCPVVLEQGQAVERRIRDTENFFTTGQLNPLSNVQFGEGGAGAFSDGKLNTRIKDPRCAQVLQLWADLIDAPEIAVDARPHVGTDRLAILLPKLRQEIINMGGTFRFGAQVTGLGIDEDRKLRAVTLSTGEEIPAEAMILSPGHSARQLQENLLAVGIRLQAHPFAMGVRCEQPQEWLDRLQYGKFAGHEALGAASYSVNYRAGDVNVHSFCVCPGGEVVNASSELGHLCVNGMSRAARNSGVINGALVVTVMPPEGADPLWGVAYQRQLEKAAFDLGGGNYLPPAQRIEDFLHHRSTQRFAGLQPSVRPGAIPCDLHTVLPESLTRPLEAALADFEKKMPGFAAADGVLTAVEARTSSPIRIPRSKEDGQSPDCSGLYPTGEGAGFAGGILSSAVDGMIQAEQLMARYARLKEGSHVG